MRSSSLDNFTIGIRKLVDRLFVSNEKFNNFVYEEKLTIFYYRLNSIDWLDVMSVQLLRKEFSSMTGHIEKVEMLEDMGGLKNNESRVEYAFDTPEVSACRVYLSEKHNYSWITW